MTANSDSAAAAAQCVPGEAGSPSVKKALIRFFTAGDDKRAAASVWAALRIDSGNVWQPLAQQPQQEAVAWDNKLWTEQKNFSATSPLRGVIPAEASSITRAQLARNGVVSIAKFPERTLQNPLNPDFSTEDTWRFGWRMLIDWTDGTRTLLQGPPGVRTNPDRALAIDSKVVLTARYCDSIGLESAWDEAKFIGSGTPRAQFFTGTDFDGDKLDKDTDERRPTSLDLATTGRSCGLLISPEDPVPGCRESWADAIRSLDTSGRGQGAASVVLSDTAEATHGCVIIPALRVVHDLDAVVVRTPAGAEQSEPWGTRADSATVTTSSRVAQEHPECSLFLRTEGGQP